MIIESLFYTILYSLFGSLFFSNFYSNSFKLYINGNGGFVGKYLESTFLNSLINLNSQISYYLLMVTITILFLISIQFKITFFYKFTKKLFKKLISKKRKELHKRK